MTERLFSSASDAPDLPDREGYRQISPWAVAALIAGLLAGTAVFNPLAWIMPVVALLVGWYALRDLKTADPPRSGRGVALLGLALAMFWAVAAPAHWFSLRAELLDRASSVGTLWLTALQRNQPDVAYVLTHTAANRPPLDTPLEKRMQDDAFRRGFDGFVKQPLIVLLLKHRERLAFEPAGHNDWISDISSDFLVVNFAIRAPAELIPEVPYVRLTLRRSLGPKTQAEQWQIVQFLAVRTPDQPTQQ